MSVTSSYLARSEEELTERMIAEMEQLVDGLEPSDKTILKNAFLKIDMDKNEQIDPKELRVFLSVKWKQVLSPEAIESVIKLADVDADGMISFSEFARFQVKYMPLCRGFCSECQKIILGIDGWRCTECEVVEVKGSNYPFALCLRCFSKASSVRMCQEHGDNYLKRFSITGLNREKVTDLEGTTKVYDRNVLRPLLKRHLKRVAEGNDNEDYWINALNCIMQ